MNRTPERQGFAPAAGGGRTPEFSRPLSVASGRKSVREHRFSATADECARLARRFGYLGIDRLDAAASLQPAEAGGVRVAIVISADIVQACVVTLEPVAEHVEDRGLAEFRPNLTEAEADRLTLETEEDVIYEPLVDGNVDVGELAAQQLAVAASPFPHSPEAASQALPLDDAGDTGMNDGTEP